MERRTFMVATAVAIGSAATAGQAGARASPELNADSDLTPIPYADATVEIDDVEIGGDPLAFTEDDGTETSLSNYGATVEATPTDDDGDPEPHNPFTLRADYIDADEYGAFPRDRTDEDDDPISALDAEFWTEVDGEMTVSDTTPASGGDGLELSTDGVADGSEAVAEFTEVDVTSGVLRKEIQLVVSVAVLEGTVELRVGDGTEWAVATIDETADADADGTIATSTNDGIVYQTPVGDLVDELDAISTVQVAAVDGDAELEVAALNAERESPWSFGNREVWDEDDDGEQIDEITTEEFVEPVGEFSIRSLGGLDDVFSGGTVDVEVGVEHYPTSTEYEVGEPNNPAYDDRLEIVDNIEIPSAYDLSYSDVSLELELGLSPDQWSDLETATVDDPIGLGDRDDETFTDHSGELDTAEVDDVVSLGSATSGDVVAVSQSLDVTADQLDEIEAGAVTGFWSGGGGGGFLSSPMGIVSTVTAGVVSYMAIARGWLASLLGGS